MSETYVECLIKAKSDTKAQLLKILLIALTVIFAFLGFAAAKWYMTILAIACGVGAYFVGVNNDVEYEYLYLDRELVIDKVLAKTRRKRVGTYSLDRIEIFAPIKSYHLDNYRNRNANVKDYSIGEELKPDRRYVLYYEGGEKLILSPSEELVKAMKNVAPRKVFMD